MIVLKGILLTVLILSSISLIGLILLQRSKSEGLGLAFGASTGESLWSSSRKCTFKSNSCFGCCIHGSGTDLRNLICETRSIFNEHCRF